MTRETWVSYSCLGKDADHARCMSGPDHPSPQGIAPVCTCLHHREEQMTPDEHAQWRNARA